MKKIIIPLLALLNIITLSAEETLRIEFITPSIVRVTGSIHEGYPSNETGVCVYQKQNVPVETTETEAEITYTSSELIVILDKHNQTVCFQDMDENTILNQGVIKYGPSYQERVIYDEKSAHVEETANGKVTVKDVIRRDTIGRSTRYTTTFYNNEEKALYGLGAHMEDYMNLQGKTMYLTQHNLKVTVPLLLSTGGYGLLFDAGCAMLFKSDEAKHFGCGHGTGYVSTMQLEAAKSLDYYFIKGSKLNDIIAGYHYLTGKVSMMPRYLFGYTQSKERYVSSDDILKTLGEYRRRHVPIDMIVQDWNYWPQGWGYMKMNRKYYPSPKALADSVHAMNAKLMVSIWANPQWCPEAEDFKSRGMMLEHDVYDAFNHEARKLYWKYANDEFYSQGFDAWWCDSSEPLDGDWNRIPPYDLCAAPATVPDASASASTIPAVSPAGSPAIVPDASASGSAALPAASAVPYSWDSHAYRWKLNKDVLSEALGAERSNLYSLYHAMGIYENQRQQMVNDEGSLTEGEGIKRGRVVNLTRSSYAGQQRYGTIVWNGDTHASWKSFRQQIPAGLNYMATGNPYWTVDIGSFFTRNDGRRWFYKGEFPQGVKDDNYKEYYTRMFQWGTFLPMLRSHGSDTPREIWQFGEPGTQYYDAILKMINLRYAHIPYIYSMAAAQSRESYTMARLLAFDYANDDNVLDIKDQFMFGDFLVCPITHPMSETDIRKVYLPKGETWKDFWSGKLHEGGQWIECKAEIGTLPLFVKSGAIIPTTEVAEYSDAQFGKPVTINIYPGKDAAFTLYEDEGDNYNFEQGAYTLIPLTWDDAKHTLTIGQREGSFAGMLNKRTFTVKTPDGMKTVTYKGKKTTVTIKGCSIN